MTSLRTIASRIRETADEKGWQKPDWETNFVQKLAFALTELDEGVQWVHGTGADPLGEELADTAIRLLDVVHAIWPERWSPGRIEDRRSVPKPVHVGAFQPIEVLVWPTVRHICRAIECWRKNDPFFGAKDAMIHCELGIMEIFRLADRVGIDLLSEIEKKTAFNATRPHLHGKGRNVG